ncbi:MAG: hypothetical protein EOP04_29695 [Proteobacteria bacterium]|nr:MAG: hypothetical protein EOP04_29695 [Pseudomonadota bacterium]
MILARRDASGNLKSPIEAGEVLVSYYPRRLDVTQPYDPIDNPVELFRAEIPFRVFNATTGIPSAVQEGSYDNAAVGSVRYPTSCGSDDEEKSRQSLWLAHNYWGEANLESLTKQSTTAPITKSSG